jgi:hypothetical protein
LLNSTLTDSREGDLSWFVFGPASFQLLPAPLPAFEGC